MLSVYARECILLCLNFICPHFTFCIFSAKSVNNRLNRNGINGYPCLMPVQILSLTLSLPSLWLFLSKFLPFSQSLFYSLFLMVIINIFLSAESNVALRSTKHAINFFLFFLICLFLNISAIYIINCSHSLPEPCLIR